MTKPYRGDLGIVERLSQDGPLPSLNRIVQDRRDALAEIERLCHDRLDCQVIMDSQQIEIERLRTALDAALYSLCTDDYESQQGVAEDLKRANQQQPNKEINNV